MGAEALRSEEGNSQYSELKTVLQRLQSGQVRAGDKLDALVASVADAVRKALTELDGTRNSEAAKVLLAVLTEIIASIEQLAAVVVPDMRVLHQRAQRAEASAEEFEVDRANSDWTVAMTQREAQVFGEVDTVLDETRAQLRECEAIHQTLYSYQIEPLALDSSSSADDLELVHAALRRLRELEGSEERKYGQLERGLDAQLARFNKKAETSEATVTMLTSRIQSLLGDLADAHAKAWRDRKKVLVCERTMALLRKKQRINQSLAEGEEEELLRLERDVKAAAAAAAIADAVNHDAAASLRAIAQEREADLVTDLFDLYVDHLTLLRRKYYQVSLSVFAAESAVEILRQEQDGVLTKKQRANAAKRPDLVAACNDQLATLETKLNDELDRIATLQDQLASLQDDWEVSMDTLEALDITDAQRTELADVKTAWKALLEQIRAQAAAHRRLVDLDNRLDATFLSQA